MLPLAISYERNFSVDLHIGNNVLRNIPKKTTEWDF